MILTRENTMDKFIVSEMSRYGDYEHIWNICKGLTILDIGGNIGAFAYTAFEYGAKEVISYEPDIDNFNLLVKNSKGICVNKAITEHGGKVKFYINPGVNKGTHSTIPLNKDGVKEVIVESDALVDVLHKYRPDILKIDIEGGEYSLSSTLANLPDFIKHIAIEFDTGKGDWMSIIKSLKFKDKTRNHFFSGERI